MGPKRKSSSATSSGGAGKKVDDGRETPLQAILLAGNNYEHVNYCIHSFLHSFFISRFLHEDIPSDNVGLSQSVVASS